MQIWMAISKTLNHWKISEKHKRTQPAENQKNTQTEISAKWGSGFYVQLARGLVSPLCLPISYATERVH